MGTLLHTTLNLFIHSISCVLYCTVYLYCTLYCTEPVNHLQVYCTVYTCVLYCTVYTCVLY